MELNGTAFPQLRAATSRSSRSLLRGERRDSGPSAPTAVPVVAAPERSLRPTQVDQPSKAFGGEACRLPTRRVVIEEAVISEPRHDGVPTATLEVELRRGGYARRFNPLRYAYPSSRIADGHL